MPRLTLRMLLLALVLTLLATSSALADRSVPRVFGAPGDTRSAGEAVQRGTLPVAATRGALRPAVARPWLGGFRPLAVEAAPADPVIGDTVFWLGLDDVAGQYYPKPFTLRAIGTKGEVWVADDLEFQADDCRNGERTMLTDVQVTYLLHEFDATIYPKESATFSVPPARDGSAEQVTGLVDPADAALFHPQGPGDRTVILVDNVRDESWYDLDNSQGSSYIAGFFSSQLNELFDRNVMTIDAFDWIHRTGESPPDNPVPGDLCASAPARPFLYEGTFAHEYQHLLESYADPDEVNWVNEGLSDWAQTLTGYVDPALPITDKGFDSHIQGFLGWLAVQTSANPNPRGGGPENSLTWWEDQGPGEILSDYGAAYSMMEFLAGRYGNGFMSALHRGEANGLAAVEEVLQGGRKHKTRVEDVLHDWALMAALDQWIDQGARISGFPQERRVTTPTLRASINWDAPDAYSSPGAPPNGADYVRLRGASGAHLRGDQIDSLDFAGATTLPPKPLAWTVAASPPDQPANPALYSGTGSDRDEGAAARVTVPAGAPALTFRARWNLEESWDFGYVQVSTDNGASYTSLACTSTTSAADPGAVSEVVAQLPGYTGDSGGFRTETCALGAYAGQPVVLAFRTINDTAAEGQNPAIPAGFWVDDVRIGATVVSDGASLAGWTSFTELRPTTVSGFTVYLVSMRDRNRDTIRVRELPLTSGFAVRGKSRVQRLLDGRADFVAAIVIFDDPAEQARDYARYRLTVNGVVQPGGGM